jgi:predicted GTPase
VRCVLLIQGEQGSGKSKLANAIFRAVVKLPFAVGISVYTTQDPEIYDQASRVCAAANKEEIR